MTGHRASGASGSPPALAALALLLFLVPLEAPDRFAYELTTLASALFLVCALATPRASFGRIPWAIGWFALYYMVVLLAVVLRSAGYPGGLHFDEIFKILVLLLVFITVCCAVANLLADPRAAVIALSAFLMGCVTRAALPLVGIGRTAHLEGTGGERVTAFGQNANQSAQVLALGIVVLIGLVYARRTPVVRPRAVVWALLLLLVVALVATGSRGGLATLLIGLVVYLGMGHDLGARVRNFLVGAVAITVVIAVASQSDVMRERVGKTVERGSMSQREHIYPLLVGMFAERPMLGWGPITNKYELARRLGDPDYGKRDAHNGLLEILTTTGIVGLFPFLLGVMLCVGAAWSARAGPNGLAPLAMVLAILVGNMGENRIVGPLFWIVMGYALASGTPARISAPPPHPRRPAAPRAAPEPVWRSRATT